MSLPYLDGDTNVLSHQAPPDGGTLDELAGRLHFDCEYLGRLLQLPTATTVQATTEPDLWRTDELNGVL